MLTREKDGGKGYARDVPWRRVDFGVPRKEDADAAGQALAANTVRGLNNDADDVSHDDHRGICRNNPTVHVENRAVPNLLVLASTNQPWP